MVYNEYKYASTLLFNSMSYNYHQSMVGRKTPEGHSRHIGYSSKHRRNTPRDHPNILHDPGRVR